jgi:hypothetical protein
MGTQCITLRHLPVQSKETEKKRKEVRYSSRPQRPRKAPAPRLEDGLTYRPGLDRAPGQPLRHGHTQAREGERVDPGPLGRCAEPGSRKFGSRGFGSRGGSREPARRGNAFREDGPVENLSYVAVLTPLVDVSKQALLEGARLPAGAGPDVAAGPLVP